MSHLNRNGDEVLGVDAGGAWVAKYLHDPVQVTTSGGAWSWITDKSIGGQRDTGGDTWECWEDEIPPSLVRFQLAPRGASNFYGGGGRWCAWLDNFGYFDSDGRYEPDMVALDCSRQGHFLRRDFQSGTGTQLVYPSGLIVNMPQYDGQPFLFLDRDIIRPYPHDLGMMVQNRPDGRLVVTADNEKGWVLSTDGKDNNPDIVWLEDEEQFYIVSNESTGELPNLRRQYFINPILNPAGPIDSDDVVEPPPSVDPYPRKMWTGAFFSHSDRYGDTSDPVGNVIICVEGPEHTRRVLAETDWAIIVDPVSYVPEGLDRTIAYWCAKGTLGELREVIEATQELLPEKPIIAYLDSRAWPEVKPEWFDINIMWPAVMTYRNHDESMVDYMSAIDSILDRVESYGGYTMLVTQNYTRNGAMSLADTTEGLTEVDIWARTSDCIGILAFADMRPSGMEDHPVLKDWFKVWAAANPARPSRWDYWTSADTDPDFVLKEKLRQSPDIPKVLTAEESERLIAALDHECPAEPPINIGDLLPLVEYTRGLYPATLTPEESGRVINHVAWVLAMETGLPFGLSVKRGGNNVPSPQGEPVAYDIVELQGAQRLWDCFTDEAANMTATWHETEYHEQPDSRPWLAPVAP